MNRNLALVAAAITLMGLHSAPATAGTFATITIDANYSDWAGVPVIDADPADNFSGPDIANTQIANDGKYLYIRNTFHNSLSLGTFITVDVDENPATGFDIFSLGLVGTEAGWQNDFGFTQATGVFNDGVGLAGEFFDGGHALLDAFADAGSRELAVSLTNLRKGGGAATFPDNTIRLLVWTDKGTGPDGLPAGFPGDDGLNHDVSGVINYTLAVPEPASSVTAGALAVALLLRRRAAK